MYNEDRMSFSFKNEGKIDIIDEFKIKSLTQELDRLRIVEKNCFVMKHELQAFMYLL
jgi:hypothetical protein